MAVRNFYINAEIDGRKTRFAGGPAGKHGGLSLVLTQRNHGGIEKALSIYCHEHEGKLYTDVYCNEEFVGRYETER